MNRKILTVLIIMLLLPAALHAQSGLNINRVFKPAYRDLPGATETIIEDARLRKQSLSFYHSITFTGQAELGPTIERLVSADGSKALSKEVNYKSGHLYYGFYRLKPSDGENRYILYLNGHLAGDNRILLIYLEGKATPEQVKKMIK